MSSPSPRSESSSQGLVARRDFIGSFSRFWKRTYAPDYVGVVLLLAAYLLMEFLVVPFHRMFYTDNIALAYPHTLEERVPLPALFAYAGGIPLAVIIIWCLVSKADSHKMHVTLLAFFIGMLLTSFVTDLIKNAVGRPRPDLISRCKPSDGTPDHILVSFEVCTENDHHRLHDGWRSFPSGHSSFAFSGFGFLALFLAGQMHVFRPEGDLARGLLALAPLLAATLIAISRCEDYRHDVYDVTCGSILGMVIAYWSYRRFYPRLRNVRCERPFACKSDNAEWYSKMKDDEESVNEAGTGPSAFTLGEEESGDES